MASSYTISDGSGVIQLTPSTNVFRAIQIVSDSALDATVTVKLQQSSNDSNYEDLEGTLTTIVAGENTVLIETSDYTLDNLYLDVDVGSATLGTLNIFESNKKKVTSNVNVVSNPSSPFKETNFDAFGRLRTSSIHGQADLKQIHDELPLFYDIEEIATGTATYQNSTSETQLETAASGDATIMQTKQRFNYSSGKSALIYITFREFDTESNVIKRVGYFNSNTSSPYSAGLDGLLLENFKGTINLVIAKSSVTKIAQSSWDDPLDGTGASGVDLELGTESGNYIFWIDYEWLGVGNVRFGFIKNGTYYVAHQVDHILSDGVYMQTPNHSIRAEIRQTGAGSGTFRLICATFNVENGEDTLGKNGGISDNGTHLDANSTSSWYYAIGIRLGSTKLDTLVEILDSVLKSDTNDSYEYRICFNPTYASTVTYTAITNSSVEYGLGVTANTVSSPGYIIKAGYGDQNASNNISVDSALKLGSNIDGTADEIVVIVRPHTSNLDIHRAINWKEVS